MDLAPERLKKVVLFQNPPKKGRIYNKTTQNYNKEKDVDILWTKRDAKYIQTNSFYKNYKRMNNR